MSELSLPWTTDATTGDQQASYTQAQLAILHKIVAACNGFGASRPASKTSWLAPLPGRTPFR